MFAQPVPPFATPKMPEMSLVRLTSDVDTAPAVAFRIPARLPTESEPKNAFVDEAYDPEMPVDEAYPNVV